MITKLERVLDLLEIDNEEKALHKLMDFLSQVEALRGKKLANEQADYLIAETERIIDLVKR